MKPMTTIHPRYFLCPWSLHKRPALLNPQRDIPSPLPSTFTTTTMSQRILRVFTILKERGFVSYAKIATIGGFCDVDLIIIKATCPDDSPLPERYIQQILKMFSVSPSSFRAFSLSFTRRFSRTHCWRVAFKCLLLLHRLWTSVGDDSPLRSELLYAKCNGLLCLNPYRFRDTSSSSYEDYTKFIRSYAQLLDEALDSMVIDHASPAAITYEDDVEDNEFEESSLANKLREVTIATEVLLQCQSLIDRVIDCRPTGSASRSFLIRSAMKHIIRYSFACYTIYKRDIIIVLDNLFQLPYRSCVSAFGIYKTAAVQANELAEFYAWCMGMGYCGSYEYPYVERIPKTHVESLENILNGMWQLSESSSFTTSQCQSSPSYSMEDDSDHQQRQMMLTSAVVASDQWEKFDEDERKVEEQPLLIQWEAKDNNVDWEILLEKSINMASQFPSQGHMFRFSTACTGEEIQVYNPNLHQQGCYGYGPSNPAYPWGL